MALGENIKSRREALKLSQEYIAEQLGVSRQAVSKWETGQSEPTASNLIQLAEVLEVSLSELVRPHKNNAELSTTENGRPKKRTQPYSACEFNKNCNYYTSSISVQLHISFLPASSF